MHADPQVRRDYLKRYANSDKGRAARQKAHDRYVAKRHTERPSAIDATPLATAIARYWRAQ